MSAADETEVIDMKIGRTVSCAGLGLVLSLAGASPSWACGDPRAAPSCVTLEGGLPNAATRIVNNCPHQVVLQYTMGEAVPVAGPDGLLDQYGYVALGPDEEKTGQLFDLSTVPEGGRIRIDCCADMAGCSGEPGDGEEVY